MSDKKLFGWVTPAERTPAQHEANERILAGMPKFQLIGNYREEKGKWFLWEFAKRVNGGKHIRYVNQVTGSCLLPDAPVRMADGSEKAIVDVCVGDQVVTHTGQHKSVVGTMNRQYAGDMYTFEMAGFAFPITMTGNHLVAVMRPSEACKWRWQPDELHWVRADEVKVGDHVIIGWSREEDKPKTFDMLYLLKNYGDNVVSDSSSGQEKVRFATTKPHNAINRFVRVNKDLGRLLGLYLAEGGVDVDHASVTLSFNAEEKHLITDTLRLFQDVFGVTGKVSFANPRMTCAKVIFYSRPLALILKHWLPGNVYSKRVPSFLMSASTEVKTAVLRAWMDGDGHAREKKDKRGGRSSVVLQGVTVSKHLARDMAVIAMSLGMRAAVSKRKARKQSKEAYDVYLSGKNAATLFPEIYEARSHGSRFSDNDAARCEFGYCRKVKTISKEYVEGLTVYDIEVDEDHSFLHCDIVHHNCVGAGGGNAVKTLAHVEIANGDPEEWPKDEFWWLYTYGQSRKRAGLGGRGEGSFGSAYAEAIVKDGIFFRTEGKEANASLPDYEYRDGWIRLPQSVEMEWSDGASKNIEPFKSLGLKHLVKTAAKINSSDEAKAAIANGYPITIASNFGTRTIRAQGNPQVQLAEWDDRWPHQMHCCACWDHPDLGLIFYILNNWGSDAHPNPLNDEPPGGFWIRASTFDLMLKDEGFALSALNGFPARELSWYI